MSQTKTPTQRRPLVVDLDSSLLLMGLTSHAIIHVWTHLGFSVWEKFGILWRLVRHKALSQRDLSYLDAESLPLNPRVVDAVKRAHAQGRTIVLVTRSAPWIAEAIAGSLGIHSAVVVIPRERVGSSRRASPAILESFGATKFDYVGSASLARSLAAVTESALLVRPTSRHLRRLLDAGVSADALGSSTLSLGAVMRSLRPHQWVKNLLLFVPLFFGFSATPSSVAAVLVGFLLFSLMASAIYVFNDVLDLVPDQQHPSKRLRPLPMGDLSVRVGVVTGVILGSVAIVGSNVLLSSTFASVVVFYALVALAYNLVLKRRAGADLVGLSILYTLRLVAGAVAGGSELSNWLLAFSVFGFLSLAAAKRVVEILSAQLLRHEQTVNNRGYVLTDSQTLSIVGVGSGLLSVLVIGLYIEEAALETPYQSPQLLWLLVPLWAYWVVRLWISVGRGDVDADPVIHVIRDWVSLAVVAAAVLIVLIARWAPL